MSAGIIKAIGNLMSESQEISEKQKLKILMVGAEVAPFAAVGGYAMVLAYLSKALVKRGHDVRVFMPKFGFIDKDNKYKLEMVHEGLEVPTDDPENPFLICNVKSHVSRHGVTIYFLENMEYYEKRANVYGYSDDSVRWALLSRGALEFVKLGFFTPDIIHSNDWHTGAVSNYLKTVYKEDENLTQVASLFTIHSLAHQGMFDHKHVSELDFDDGKSELAPLFSERITKQNFMKRGILYSDAVNTVSKTYSKEILTGEYGEGLDKLLLEVRSKMFGILNGLDYEEFDPATDSLIEQNYDIANMSLREENKKALQKEFDLTVDPTIPVIGISGRLDYQKGVDLTIRTMFQLLKDYDVQFLEVGGGDGGLAEQLQQLKQAFPNKVGIHPYPNFTLPRLMFAGCDLMLFPSRFEPCGIVQLECMRYGSIPIIRKVGGLADTVENFNSVTGEGTGFVFTEFNEFALFGQLARALEIYNNKTLWKKLQKNTMNADFSWNHSAAEYEKLYIRCLKLKKHPYPVRGSI